MALKPRGLTKAIKGIKDVSKGVQKPMVDNPNREKVRKDAPLPSNTPPEARKTSNFSEITLTGSKGETYTVVIPTTYAKAVPKVWEWTEERYRVAELIAEGIPIAQIPGMPNVSLKSRMTIYGWLEHPEFKKHVDGLVMETGWANRRERIANLSKLQEVVLRKVMKDIDKLELTDKGLGALLGALQSGSKLLAQEKGEFIEESKVTQDTNLTGTVTSVTAKLDDLIASKTDEEKKKLEKEFDQLGDDIIRSLTGAKDN